MDTANPRPTLALRLTRVRPRRRRRLPERNRPAPRRLHNPDRRDNPERPEHPANRDSPEWIKGPVRRPVLPLANLARPAPKAALVAAPKRRAGSA